MRERVLELSCQILSQEPHLHMGARYRYKERPGSDNTGDQGVSPKKTSDIGGKVDPVYTNPEPNAFKLLCD